jgi:hypothetical protein
VSLAAGAAIPLLFPRYAYERADRELTLYHRVEPGLFAELSLWVRLN